jgi:preprotein translocase subunit SecG
MSFFIGLLTLVLVLNCVLLILLVLIQLPKKEAGAGLAFGGAATDALFGAGTGNVLTKLTKYATGVFFCLAMFLAFMQSRQYHQNDTKLQRLIDQQSKQSGNLALPPAAPSSKSAPSAAAGNLEAPLTATATNSPAPAPVKPAPVSAPQK